MPYPMAACRGKGSPVAVFSPLSLAPALWLRADLGLFQDSAGTTPAVADADPVGRWSDQSGNGNHPTAAGGARPMLKLAIINGKPVVRFDGADDWLDKPGLTLNQPLTVFAVASGADDGFNPWYAGYGAAGAFRQVLMMTSSGFAAPKKLRMNAGTGRNGTTTLVNGTVYTAAAQFNGASSKAWLNGAVELTAGDAGAGNAGALAVGSDDGTGIGEFLKGDLAELIVYGTALTDADMANVFSYLRTKYAHY